MSALPSREQQRTLPTWPFNWQLVRYRPWPYIVYSIFHMSFFIIQVIPGLIEKAVFDAITGADPVTVGLWKLIAMYISIELVRQAASFGEIWGDVTFRYTTGALLRFNLFASALRRPGALPLPVPVGDAISRYDHDVGETSDFPLWIPDMAGQTISSLIAVIIMARINLTITLVIFLPLALSIIVARLAWSRIHRYRHAAREATGNVIGFLRELFSAVQAVKIAKPKKDAIEQFPTLNEAPPKAMLRDPPFCGLPGSISHYAGSLWIGRT